MWLEIDSMRKYDYRQIELHTDQLCSLFKILKMDSKIIYEFRQKHLDVIQAGVGYLKTGEGFPTDEQVDIYREKVLKEIWSIVQPNYRETATKHFRIIDLGMVQLFQKLLRIK
jgi:hypothetical protein